MHAFVIACAVVLAAATPLEEDIDFQEGRRLVDELDYERAVFRFQKLTKSDRPVEQRAAAWAWLGLTYANLGDEGEAIKAFVAAIKLDPLVVLPPSSPKVAETKNGFEDADGCPDQVPVAAPVDDDGDGIVGDADRCPTAAETGNGFQDTDGCPDEAPPPPPQGPPVLLLGGAAAAGVGVVGVVTGAALGVLATSTNDEAVARSFQDERAALAGQARSYALGANVALIGGGLLAATGGALVVMSLVGGAP
jgi:tetratricopeptide (TPR) repeat protein